jgi:tRNA A-37 threonylcarbamoyl transferase component Bud32
MMRDKHEFTGDVNIPCEAYHRRYDGQFHRHSITGRQIHNVLQRMAPVVMKERSARQFRRQTLDEALDRVQMDEIRINACATSSS